MTSTSGSGSDLSLQVEPHGQSRVVKPIGRIDFATTPDFQDALTQQAAAVGRGAGLIVDLSGVDLITSAGLRALMQTKKRLSEAGAQLVVVGVAGAVADVIRVSRLDTLLTLKPTVSKALEMFGSDPGAA